jgi:hypothetical protein
VSRLLDAALGESAVKQPTKTLESALAAFEDLTGSSSSSSSSSSSQQQQQQRLLADAQFAEPWVRAWTQLLSRARSKLAKSLLLGESVGSSSGSSSSSSSAEAAAELEQELEVLRAKEAAAAGEYWGCLFWGAHVSCVCVCMS